MIDLRSDTVTLPSPEMREAMARAVVGDDVYGDDPTINELEMRTAELLGKEAAVFVPTGTMSNQIAMRAHTEPGDLAVVHATSHILRSEGGAGAALCGVTMRAVSGPTGVFGAQDVEDVMEPPHAFNAGTLNPRVRLVCVENTHSGGGGTVWELPEIESVCDVAGRFGLATHLDGARLWHATAASGVAESAYAAPFDTVNVCFSKGLGAPVGSALAGSKEVIARARRFKQQFGGGFRQAGILAAAAIYSLDHHRSELARDVELARLLAGELAILDGIDLDVTTVQSNIVRFSVTLLSAGDFTTRCHAAGVHMLPGGRCGVRAVLHRDIDRDAVMAGIRVIAEVLAATPGTGDSPNGGRS